MKQSAIHFKTGMILLMAVFFLGFQSCTGFKPDPLKKACGEWVSTTNNTSFSLYKQEDTYMVKMQRTIRGRQQTELFRITEQNGYYFIETGFSILISYDKKSDTILLSNGGEYRRKSTTTNNPQ